MAVPHYRDARMQHSPMQCPSYTAPRVGNLCGLSRSRFAKSPVRLRERSRHYRCTPLQQKLWEGTRAVPGPRRCPPPPQRKAPRTTWVNGLPTIPTAANLAAESISPITGTGEGGKQKMRWCCVVCIRCEMKYGGDPPQPTSIHLTITAHQRILLLCPM